MVLNSRVVEWKGTFSGFFVSGFSFRQVKEVLPGAEDINFRKFNAATVYELFLFFFGLFFFLFRFPVRGALSFHLQTQKALTQL